MKAKFRIGLWLVLAVDGSRAGCPAYRGKRVEILQVENCEEEKKHNKKGSKRSRHAKARKPGEQEIPLQSTTGRTTGLANAAMACCFEDAVGLEDRRVTQVNEVI